MVSKAMSGVKSPVLNTQHREAGNKENIKRYPPAIPKLGGLRVN